MKPGLAALLVLILSMSAPAVRAQESAALAEPADDWPARVAAIVAANAETAQSPLTAPIRVCAGTACQHQSDVVLSEDEAVHLRQLFAAVDDAASERRAIARAIARIEDFVGTRNGTWADAPGNRHADVDEPDQLDCVSETANTQSYLDRLRREGLVTRHHLGRMVIRYTLILQHVASTIVVDDGADGDGRGAEFVIDSWPGANGEEPSILPLDDWRSDWEV